MNVHLITDTHGRVLTHHEPEPGSVLLVNGVHGSAWQRSFIDGRWRSTQREGAKPWSYVLRQRNVLLVYNAPVRMAPLPVALLPEEVQS